MDTKYSLSKKVIIIGSGPAGLAAALRLKVKNGVEAVVVYEVRDAPTSLGGAVMVPCNGLRLLDRLGLYDELARRTALKELAIQPLDPPLTATFLPDGLFVAVDCTAAQDLLFWFFQREMPAPAIVGFVRGGETPASCSSATPPTPHSRTAAKACRGRRRTCFCCLGCWSPGHNQSLPRTSCCCWRPLIMRFDAIRRPRVDKFYRLAAARSEERKKTTGRWAQWAKETSMYSLSSCKEVK